MLYQAGGAYFDPAGKAQLGNDAGKRAIDFLVSFFRDGLANPNLVYQGTGPTPLVAGTAAMTYDGVVEQQNAIQNSPGVESKILAGVPLTADAGGPPRTIAWINKLAISARTPEPEGAWMLLSFLMSKTIASKFAELWGGLPSRTDLSNAAYLEGYSAGFSAATQYAGSLPTNPNLLQIQQQVNIAMQRAIRLEAPGAQILAELDARIDQINGK
jgi:multiple sugar transport system substrate-binding protein